MPAVELQKPLFYDSHAHFSEDGVASGAVVQRALAAGVHRIVAVGATPELNGSAKAVATRFPDNVRLALGFDRSQATDDPHKFSDMQAKLECWAKTMPLSALGECGLDFYYEQENKEEQIALFIAHLELSEKLQLPVIIHTRSANDETVEALDNTPWSGAGWRGVAHCFTGDSHFAQQLLDRGLAISFSGIVTFRNADMLRKSAAYIPEDRLLIESDAPYLAPVPLRGKTNEPAFISHTAACIAKVRGVSLEHLADVTTANAIRLFGS